MWAKADIIILGLQDSGLGGFAEFSLVLLWRSVGD